MARPIKETPTLYGEDARRFAYAVEHPLKVTDEEIAEIIDSCRRISAMATFTF